MSFYRYVVKTPFQQMVRDFEEYRILRNKCNRLINERDFRQKQVAEPFNGVKIKCIQKYPTGRRVGFKPEYTIEYCCRFFDKVCDAGCPRRFQHDRYWKMVAELKELQLDLACFWQKKFHNVK